MRGGREWKLDFRLDGADGRLDRLLALLDKGVVATGMLRAQGYVLAHGEQLSGLSKSLNFEAGPEVGGKVSKAIEIQLGKGARPENVWHLPDLPKARLGQTHPRVRTRAPHSTVNGAAKPPVTPTHARGHPPPAPNPFMVLKGSFGALPART